MKHNIEEYDKKRLIEARKIIWKVQGYYYGAPGYTKIIKRLETILKKIDYIITNDQQ